ncbi:unnamed protein product [Brassica rapa]|uniref:Uncharacterized protein n=1 Tax=Brassica campestris TaxID=3711 RepID=A0A8D9CYI1_BRACM|nr:unnamed protein product [Brassica rapa]
MRYHLTEELRNQFENIEDPYDLWIKLKSIYSMELWQKAMDEWKLIIFQDFESMEKYHPALMKIAYSLELCGEVAKGFTTYNDLLSYLFAIKQRKQKIKDTIRRFEKLQKRYIEQ